MLVGKSCPPRSRSGLWRKGIASAILGAILLAGSLSAPFVAPDVRGLSARPVSALQGPYRTFLPMAVKPVGCQPLGGQTYLTTAPNRATDPTTDAERDPDVNLALRGYVPYGGSLSLVNYNGNTDASAPQAAGLFAYPRYPTIAANYLVRDWNWLTMQPGAPVSRQEAEVTMTGLGFAPGETLRVPDAPGRDIGDDARFEVLVLYASESRITFKYSREDNVIVGYTLHVENVCIEPSLVSLYRQMDAQGRGRLPGLVAGQPFGRARTSEVDVAIRDWGSFMDPRSQKDWWNGF